MSYDPWDHAYMWAEKHAPVAPDSWAVYERYADWYVLMLVHGRDELPADLNHPGSWAVFERELREAGEWDEDWS